MNGTYDIIHAGALGDNAGSAIDRQPEEIRAYAHQRHIRQIAWLKAEGEPEIEALAHEQRDRG
jgi:hypothetical protein